MAPEPGPLSRQTCPAYASNLDATERRKLQMPKEITFEDALTRAKRMSEKYVDKGSYVFFPMPEIVEEVQNGLAKNLVNHGRLYCP